MTLRLYSHPFSSYCQKVLIALYEAGTPFESVLLEGEAHRALAELWPLGKFPVLVDEARDLCLPEASIIIEYLDLHHPGRTRMLPEDSRAALDARLLDRFFDNYVMTPQQKIVADRLRAPEARDPHGVAEAQAMLDRAYRWLDARLDGRIWAAGAFGLADCAAAPALFYADWVRQIGGDTPNLRAYLARLRTRPSFARAVAEARPYRPLFPGGVPAHAD